MRLELTEPRAHACDVRLHDDEQLFVGRSSCCEIEIPCKSVSKRHARFIRDGEQVVVEDLGSRNGIRVNGVSVTSAYLEPGDLIQIGRATVCLKGPSLVNSAEESGFRLLSGEPEALPRLVMVDDASSSWDLSESSTIGSREENSICISALGVSRFHAEVVQQDESWVIIDLGATNGVEVNGEKVETAVLNSGDEITIGETTMRFELVAPGGRSLRGRVRLALAAAAALLLCATGVSAASQNGEPVASVTRDAGEHVESAMSALIAGEFDAAGEAIRLGETLGDTETRRSCRTLGKLKRELVRLESTGTQVLWERAEEAAAEARHLDLGSDAQVWLDETHATMKRNHWAADSLKQALDSAALAQHEPLLDSALDGFMHAAVICDGITADTEAFAEAQEAASRVREQAIARISSDLRGLEAQDPPAWSGMQDVAERGLEFTQDSQQRLTLRQVVARSQRERAAATLLARAEEEVAGGRAASGLRTLENISRTSYYAPAKMQVTQRVELAELLRRAKTHYARGAGQQARDTLDEAFDLDHLPLEFVQQQVGSLRQSWVAVERAFKRATRAAKSGDRLLARDAYNEVLRLESDPSNRFHAQALSRLAYLTTAIRDSIESDLQRFERTLDLPLEELQRAELAEAGQLAARIQAHPALTPTQGARIPRAIDELVSRLGARERVQSALFANDIETLERIGAQLAFLQQWLPAGPEQKDLVLVQERLTHRLAREASARRLTQSNK